MASCSRKLRKKSLALLSSDSPPCFLEGFAFEVCACRLPLALLPFDFPLFFLMVRRSRRAVAIALGIAFIRFPSLFSEEFCIRGMRLPLALGFASVRFPLIFGRVRRSRCAVAIVLGIAFVGFPSLFSGGFCIRGTRLPLALGFASGRFPFIFLRVRRSRRAIGIVLGIAFVRSPCVFKGFVKHVNEFLWIF